MGRIARRGSHAEASSAQASHITDDSQVDPLNCMPSSPYIRAELTLQRSG